jgi:hypothetical protein
VSARRFIGIYALAAAPFVSRDLSELLATVRAGRVPWPLSVRAAGVALASFAIGPLEWSRWDLPLGLSMDHASYPMRACDFMAEQGVRGRGLNTFGMASWQVFRFAGDRWQLPFIDIHQSGTRTDRDLYAAAQVDPAAWRALDALHRFDYALLARVQYGGDQLLDALDADSAFALVFKDDAAALYVRRHGPLEPVAARFAYRVVAAGRIGIGRLGEICARDSSLRGPVRAELGREVEESPWHGQATSLLANLALLEADWPHARALLDTVEMIDPGRQRVHLRLGLLDQIDGRPHEALRQFAREKEIFGGSLDLDLAEARSHAALGETGRASDAWRRALRRDPANAEAAESLAVWERRRTG